MAAAQPNYPPPKQRPTPPGTPPSPPTQQEAKPKTPKAPKSTSPWPWRPSVRVAVSLAVIFHIAAVFTAPWLIQLRDIFVPFVPPGGVLDAQGRQIPISALSIERYPPMVPRVPSFLYEKVFKHYLNFLFINHGYNFFAPDPGVSHVIDYRVYNDRGEEIAKGRFPDRTQQWPRLFYHRHMMLVDQSADPALENTGWAERIAKRLLDVHNGARVDLDLKVRRLLSPADILAGGKIDDEQQLVIVGSKRLMRDQPLPPLPPPARPPVAAAEATPTPGGPQ